MINMLNSQLEKSNNEKSELRFQVYINYYIIS